MAKEVTSFRSQPEDFGPSEFSAILAEQKEKKLKEKDAIANSAVEFLAKKRLDLGYTSDKIKNLEIGGTAVNVVTRFSGDLDGLRNVENYDELAEFVKVQDKVTKEYKKALEDSKNGRGGGRFGELNTNELGYIVEHLEPVTNELKKAAGTAQRFRFKVDEVKSAFKPAKIIDRLFGSDEGFIGKRIRAAIKRQQEAEKQVAETQRGAVGEKFRAKVEKIEAKAEGDDFTGDMGESIPEKTAMEEVAGPKSGAAQRERRKELAEQQENITEENQSIFQAIADNTELTVLYLEDLIDLQREQIKATEESGGGMGMGLPFGLGGKGKGSKPKGKGGFFKRMASKGKGLLGRAGAIAGRVAPIAARALPLLGPIGAIAGAGALAYSAFKFFKNRKNDELVKTEDGKEETIGGKYKFKNGVLQQNDEDFRTYGEKFAKRVAEEIGPQVKVAYDTKNKKYVVVKKDMALGEGESGNSVESPDVDASEITGTGDTGSVAPKTVTSTGDTITPKGNTRDGGGVDEIEFGLATGQLKSNSDGSISGFVRGYDGPTGQSTQKLMAAAEERDLRESDFPQPLNNINAPVVTNNNQSTQNVMDASATNRDNTFSVALSSAEF